MRPTVPSNCEKKSVVCTIEDGMRLDGREVLQYRETHIQFGSRYGTCQVRWGNTRVFASVTCEMGQPRIARPNEGTLHVSVDISPMAAPGVESGGRQNETSVALERLLERCIRESNCVDMESLCIVADEKVWQLRLHVTVLDHGGSLCDAAALAAVSALHHFRRPHVTVTGQEVHVCSPEEADPVPLAILHTPLLVTFVFFSDGEQMAVDATEIEERAMEGCLTVGMNSYREVCTLHLTGKLLLTPQQVLRCTGLAVERVRDLTSDLRSALAADRRRRELGLRVTLACVELERVCAAAAAVQLRETVRPGGPVTKQEIDDIKEEVDRQLTLIRRTDGAVAMSTTVGEGGPSAWFEDDDEFVGTVKQEAPDLSLVKQEPMSGSDSEEEQTTLQPEHLSAPIPCR